MTLEPKIDIDVIRMFNDNQNSTKKLGKSKYFAVLNSSLHKSPAVRMIERNLSLLYKPTDFTYYPSLQQTVVKISPTIT